MTQTPRGGVDDEDASHVWSAQGVPCKSVVLVAEEEGADMSRLARGSNFDSAREVLYLYRRSCSPSLPRAIFQLIAIFHLDAHLL